MPAKTHRINRLSILVVDDDPVTSHLLKQNLETIGAEVTEVATGLDCVKMLRQARVDLILLDLELPDFNGWGILSLLRLTRSLHNIPVIIVSVEPPDEALIAQFSPDDYIQKPFDMRDLLRRVNRVLNSKSTGQSLAARVI